MKSDVFVDLDLLEMTAGRQLIVNHLAVLEEASVR